MQGARLAWLNYDTQRECTHKRSDLFDNPPPQRIVDFLIASAGIHDPRTAQALASCSSEQFVDKHGILLRSGERQKDVWVLVDGIFRTSLIDISGRDITDCLISKIGMVIAPCADLASPSMVQVEALQPSTILAIPIEIIEAMLTQDHSFVLDYIKILTMAWQMHWDIKRAISQKTARERYQWFLKAYPGVIDLIPHRYIASYLGMTPITLSRVRNDNQVRLF